MPRRTEAMQSSLPIVGSSLQGSGWGVDTARTEGSGKAVGSAAVGSAALGGMMHIK